MDEEKISFTIGDPTYELTKEIHRGGQGIIYLVKNKTSGVEFAVKQYFASEPAALRRQMERSFKYAQIFSKQTVQGYFAPISLSIKEEERLFLELMSVAPADCKTAEDLASKWTKQEVSFLDRIQDAIRILKSLLTALDKFHKSGFVHRDITGKNLFVAENNVFPIDFGVCAELNCQVSIPSFSPGFSHPYVMESEVSVQQDIYGACAVFVLLAMGDNAIDIDTGELVNLTNDYSVCKMMNALDLSRGIREKIESMIQKVANFGYNDAEAFLKDVSSLEQIVESRGICKERLLDGSIRERDRVKLRIYGSSFDSTLLPKIDIPTENTMILSPGGGGKTSSLIDFWDRLLAADPLGRIPVYVPLAKFKKGSTYIRDYILDNYFREVCSDENRNQLRKLFCEAQIVLLLDSVNESLQSDYLGPEISELLKCPGVQIIIASRHSNIHWSELKEFRNMVLPILDTTVVNAKLEAAGLPSATGRLLETLTRPMFLCLFLNISKNPRNLENTPQTPGEILFAYYYTHLLNAFASADHTEDHLAFRKRCLFKFLPEFAFRVGSMTFDSVDWNNALQAMGIEPNSSDAVEFLSVLEDCGFIHRTGEDPFEEIVFYQFSHQFYQEFSQALFVAAQIFGRRPSVPAVLNQVLSDEVLHFLADIWVIYQKNKQIITPISIVDWLQTHAAGKPDAKMLVRNLVEALKHQRKNDLRSCKFDGLDLSATNFYHCDISEATFHNSILVGNSFVSERHRFPLEKALPVPIQNLIITSTGNETKLIAWSMADGNHRFTMDTGELILQFAISTDEKILAAACSSVSEQCCRIYMFSLEDGRFIKKLPCDYYPIYLFYFIPGTCVICLDHMGRDVAYFDTVSNEQGIAFKHDKELSFINSPDGSRFLTITDQEDHLSETPCTQHSLDICSVDRNEEIRNQATFYYRNNESMNRHWIFSADNCHLIGQSRFGRDKHLIFLDINNGEHISQNTSRWGMIQCASKKYLFTSSMVWDYQSKADVSDCFDYESGLYHQASLSADGKFVAICKNGVFVSVFSTESKQRILQFSPSTFTTTAMHAHSPQIHIANRSNIVRRDSRGRVDCLDLDSHSRTRLFDQALQENLVFCRNPKYILRECRKSYSFELWDVVEKKVLANFFGSLENVREAQYLEEHKVLILLDEKYHAKKNRWLPYIVRVHCIPQILPLKVPCLPYGNPSEVSCHAIINDRIIIGMQDGNIQIWSCTGELLIQKNAHHYPIYKILPVLGSNRFVSCDSNNHVHVWDPETAENWGADSHDLDFRLLGDSIDVIAHSSVFGDHWSDTSLLIRKELAFSEGVLWGLATKKYTAFRHSTYADGRIVLIDGSDFCVKVFSTTTGERLFNLSALSAKETVVSASVSDDGELLAVTATTGKVEIYQKGNPAPLIWDVLDVDNVVNADLSHTDLKLCNDYVLEQLMLNGAILPESN